MKSRVYAWHLALILAALFAVPALAGEEDLPLGEELPEHEPLWSGWGSLRGAEAWQGEGGFRHRLLADWRRGGLALRAAWSPGEPGLPRAGLAWSRGGWALAGGRLSGRWGGGLLLGARRRQGLGRVPSPLPGEAILRPASSRSPVLSGVVLGVPAGPLELCLGQLVDLEGKKGTGSGQILSLLWRTWRLDVLGSPRARALALDWRSGSEEAGLEVSLAAGRSPAGPARTAGLWRCRGIVGPFTLGGESMVLAGPALGEPLVSGWLGAPPGRELHVFLAGERGALRWRLARRRREGIGLASGARRLETGLTCTAPWRAGRLRASVRQIETLGREEQPHAPGFPRSAPVRAARQELRLGWEGSWLLRGVRRQGAGTAASTLLILGFQPLAAISCRLALFETASGDGSFLLMDGGALYRRVEALAGSGWRLALRSEEAGGRLALRGGASWTRRRGAEDRVALWVEGRLGG